MLDGYCVCAAGHSFPDATGVAFALMAWARHRCLQLYLLLGPEHRWCEDPIVSALFIIRAQAWRARALLFSLGLFVIIIIIIYSSNFFSRFRGLLGPLTCLKSLENWHTHWNLRPLGPGRDWYTGVAQGLYSAPWNMEGHISYILARRRMKLGTHIDLIKPNNFRTACHRLCPTGSQLFRAM